jgi:hypothetical protein
MWQWNIAFITVDRMAHLVVGSTESEDIEKNKNVVDGAG